MLTKFHISTRFLKKEQTLSFVWILTSFHCILLKASARLLAAASKRQDFLSEELTWKLVNPSCCRWQQTELSTHCDTWEVTAKCNRNDCSGVGRISPVCRPVHVVGNKQVIEKSWQQFKKSRFITSSLSIWFSFN